MVTDLQFYYAVRSYNYRTRLLEKMDGLEKRIFNYMNNNNLTEIAINGYYIDITDGIISITERPITNVNQLYIKFKDDSNNGGNGLK